MFPYLKSAGERRCRGTIEPRWAEIDRVDQVARRLALQFHERFAIFAVFRSTFVNYPIEVIRGAGPNV